MKIYKYLFTEEPESCERAGCKELNNGMMNYWIDFGMFRLTMNLCCEHSKEFDKKIKENDDFRIEDYK